MKILAMDELMPGVSVEDLEPYLKEEAMHAWKLYEQGIFRELYFRGDKPGAVNIMECKDVDEAKKIMDGLPLVKNKLIEFKFIPLEHFAPFSILFEKTDA